MDSERPVPLDYYLLNDQPMTCGMCGARTFFEVLADEAQLHECLNVGCGYRFIAVDESKNRGQ